MDELDRLATRRSAGLLNTEGNSTRTRLGTASRNRAPRGRGASRHGYQNARGRGRHRRRRLITGAKPGKCVGLRADMDALPVAENTGLPFSSQNPGVCHACGHDLHMAMLLGCAEVLQAMKNELSGSVKLIFQPAEECCPAGGAAAMIADGVLENPHVDAMFAQHVWPGQTTGVAGVRDGVIMAEADPLEFVVRGSSGHGSEPETV
jgi:amidohydrolase